MVRGRRSTARNLRARALAAATLATIALGIVAAAPAAKADPLRLRADAYAQSESPVGMPVVHGEDKVRPWIDAEAVAWLGVTDSPGITGDVQTLTVRLRDPHGRGEVRLGRFLEAAGAIRPMHIDGVRALGRMPESGTNLELFAGSPVVPRFGSRQFDYALGGRAGQAVGAWMNVGLAYVMRRAGGELLDQEVGPDVLIAPVRWFDFAGRAAFDLVHKGPTDALASIGLRKGDLRVELFTTHRSPGRMLPATSLFSVLGDHPATTGGATFKWRAAPRLDLLATAAAMYQSDNVNGDVGAYATARATLALDDDWAGNLGVELRRQSVGTAQWWGARAIAIVPIPIEKLKLRASAEVELVRFDDVPDPLLNTNHYRPWGLLALSYRGLPRWDFAGAVEATRTRDDRAEYHAMARATYAFERTK